MLNRKRSTLLKTSFLKKYFLFPLACLSFLCAAQTLHAQIGAGNLELGVYNASVYNGGSAGSTGVAAGQSYTVALNLKGVTGNGGTTTYACYIAFSGGPFQVFNPFNSSTTTSLYMTVTWAVPPHPGPYVWYCTATYSGTYANGTVTTPYLTANAS
jgi:hypothetical protein